MQLSMHTRVRSYDYPSERVKESVIPGVRGDIPREWLQIRFTGIPGVFPENS
jgi:hypothetical protein